jgi:hypothetical protein
MGQANFERHISHLTPLYGKNLKGPDQAAMQAKQRIEDRDKVIFNGPAQLGHWTPPTDAEIKQRKHDWKAIGVMAKRKTRGGGTFRSGDSVCD